MNETIANINMNIAKAMEERMSDIKTYGIAESMAIRGDEDITFPALVFPDGECIDVYSETDHHDVTIYHRLSEISFQEDRNRSFGSGTSYITTADMNLIVFGKRDIISPWEMERIVRSAIASCKECRLVRSDFSALQIFATEYAGVTYFISPKYYLFKINYRITDTYNNRCK